MVKSVALILAKADSSRLKNKNTKDFGGVPMFAVNVKKALRIFDKVYVSSDSQEILNQAMMMGAKAIWRDEDLCGDTPNIPVYQHALKHMGDIDAVLAIQANSPTISSEMIAKAKALLEMGYNEVMTCHPQVNLVHPIYGSLWGLSKWKLEHYGDPYQPEPEILLVDDSVDIHNYQDYKRALRQWLKTQA
jgi:CMP-N-acetylneuraminic acid synthetase